MTLITRSDDERLMSDAILNGLVPGDLVTESLRAALSRLALLERENEALAYELKCFHDGNEGEDVHYCGKCDDHVASAEEIRENLRAALKSADAPKEGK